jgi:aminoglycoside phosphotransferase (APT) family kinase protein
MLDASAAEALRHRLRGAPHLLGREARGRYARNAAETLPAPASSPEPRVELVHVYRLLERVQAMPTPSIFRCDDSRHVLPQSYVLMSKLPGQPLSEVASSLDDEQLRGVYEEMGRLMACIHQCTCDAFGYLTTHVLEPHATNLTYMRFQFSEEAGTVRLTWWRCIS